MRIANVRRCIGNTFCWASPTGGPTVSDCTVIADALLYESQNTGVFFNATAFGVRLPHVQTTVGLLTRPPG